MNFLKWATKRHFIRDCTGCISPGAVGWGLEDESGRKEQGERETATYPLTERREDSQRLPVVTYARMEQL